MPYLTPQREALYRAYLRRENPRPLFGCTLGMFTKEHYPRATAALPDRQLLPEDIDIEAYLADCDDLYLAHEKMNDDFPFVSAPMTSIPWMEAIMGCPIMCKDNSIWAEPCITDWAEWQPPEDLSENSWFRRLCQLTEAMVAHARGRYPVSVTLMRGPADVISAMRGAQNYVWDMIDEPEQMRIIAEKIADVYIAAAQAQLERIPDTEQGYLCGDQGMRIWQPQKFIWLQEDALSLLSPALYRQTILPADQKIVETFGHAAFHLHFNCLWMIDFLLDIPQIEVIELNLESAAVDLDATFAGWEKIRTKKPLVIWAQYDPDTFQSWMERFLREIPHEGVNFQIALFDRDPDLGIKVREIYENLKKS